MKKLLQKTAIITSVVGMAMISHAQLQWSAYDTSGNLVNANAGTGGEGVSSVNLTVGAGQTLVFVASGFQPLDMSVASTLTTVNFNLYASGGLTGVTSRDLGVGMFNSAATAGNLADDQGLFSLWNPGGPYPEIYAHASGSGNIFSGTQQGQGGNYTGTMVDQTTYNGFIRLYSSATGVALGHGSSLALAGIGFEGASPVVDQRAYINPVTGMARSFDEFAVEFANTTGDDVTLTLDSIALTVPEPSTAAIIAVGLLGLAVRNRRS